MGDISETLIWVFYVLTLLQGSQVSYKCKKYLVDSNLFLNK